MGSAFVTSCMGSAWKDPGGGVTPFSRHQAPGGRWYLRGMPLDGSSCIGIGGSGGRPMSFSAASSSASFSSDMPIGPIGMSEEKDADELAAEKDLGLPPLPPIPMQLEPSNGIPRKYQRPPGAWCRENGVTPPPGSFQPDETQALSGARVLQMESSRPSVAGTSGELFT